MALSSSLAQQWSIFYYSNRDNTRSSQALLMGSRLTIFPSLALFILVLISPIVCSQETSDQPNPPVDIPVEKVIRYLQSDIFVKPGLGLKKVRLGMTFRQVLEKWGKPEKSRRTGAFGRQIEWIYTAGDGTEILLSGGKMIGVISLRGKMQSSYETTEGARFGMATYSITSIYGRPREGFKDSIMDYPKRGIKFIFRNGRVHIITVKPRTYQ